MFSYKSNFATDIWNLMNWREALGYSKSSYQASLKSFDTYCIKYCPQANVLTKEVAFGFLNYIRENRKSRSDTAAICNLGKYQLMTGKNAYVIPPGFFSYNQRRLPYIMTEDDCARFFDAADHWPRDYANPLIEYTIPVLFRLQYATGMRPQEVRKLLKRDVDFRSATIYVAETKGHRDRLIPVDDSVMELCKKYDTISRSMYPNASCFFPNRNQQVHSGVGLASLFRKCWRMAGNPKATKRYYCSPYIFRHNFATKTLMKWIEDGVDLNSRIPYLSAYMGHETFKSTYYYIHLLPERLSRMGYMSISDVISGVRHEER